MSGDRLERSTLKFYICLRLIKSVEGGDSGTKYGDTVDEPNDIVGGLILRTYTRMDRSQRTVL